MIVKTYKNIALELLEKYIHSRISLIYEFSDNFDKDKSKLESECKYFLSKLDSSELYSSNYKEIIWE